MKLKINFNNDKIISLAIMSSFFVLTFQYLILTYFDIFNTILESQIQLTSKIIVGIFYLVALPFVLKRNKLFFLSIYLFSTFIFLLTYFVFPENTHYLRNNLFSHFFIALPSFIYAFSLNDFSAFIEIMKKVGIGVFIIGTIIAMFVFVGQTSIGIYSMSLSYYMLLPLLVYTAKLFNKFSIFDFLIVLISIIIILAIGSRGAILCYLVFLFYRLIFIKEKISQRRVLQYLTGFFIGAISLLFYREIIEYIYNLLLNLDIKSRTLNLFLQNGIYLSGREELYSTIINQLSKHPFIGLGLFGDRRFIGAYVHNIFLELWAHFGLIIGSIIISLILFVVYKILIANKNKEIANLMSIWFSLGFVHLLVSGSYIIDFKFFIFLGLSLNIIKTKNCKMKNLVEKNKNSRFYEQ